MGFSTSSARCDRHVIGRGERTRETENILPAASRSASTFTCVFLTNKQALVASFSTDREGVERRVSA